MLPGATVSLVQDGFPVPFGVTDRNGRVTAELPVDRAGAEATAVVSTAPSGRSPGYLLTAPVRVDGRDVEVTLAGNNGAVLDLLPRKGTAESLTYVSPGLAPAAAIAMPPGRVVITTGRYSLRHAYRIATPEREWWALSTPRDFPAEEPKRHRVEFGGAPKVTLHVTRAAAPTAFTLDWSVTDAGGIAYEVIARGPLSYDGPVTSPPLPVVTLAPEVPVLVGARAPRREDVIVRVYDPAGTQITAGGLAWDQHTVDRDLTAWLSTVPPGEYRIELTIGADDSPLGSLSATTSIAMG